MEGGLSTPWAVDFIPGGPMLVTSRSGTLHAFRDGRLSTIRDTPEVRNRGQGGLMDVAVHPDYEENGWIYLAYSDKLGMDDASPGMTKIVRGRLLRIVRMRRDVHQPALAAIANLGRAADRARQHAVAEHVQPARPVGHEHPSVRQEVHAPRHVQPRLDHALDAKVLALRVIHAAPIG